MISYYDMTKDLPKANIHEIASIEGKLLDLCVKSLTPAKIKKIKKELEADRLAFANVNNPSHDVWYESKLRLCKRFETITNRPS